MLPLVEGEARYEQGEPTLHFNTIHRMSEYTYRLSYNNKLTKRSQELRRNMTEPEKRIWFQILQRLDRSGIRVRRQYLIQNFIVDFYIASRKLVIEIDGESHFTETGAIQDTSRTKVLE
jgi:very-short-patch-repair endonuclease